MTKIVPSERLRRELDEVLSGVGEHEDPVEAVARLGARLILQQALEEEVTDFLGRERYARTGGAAIYRNGYEPRTVKTTSGAMELERPRIRNADELGFESQVLGKGVARTHALEALIILGFLRGLSVRDVEALLEETFGEQVVGKSTVARICQDTRERYRAWCERRLDRHDLVYCYLDAIYLKLRPDDEPAEGVLVAWGLTLEGQKVLLGLQLGSRESYESWLDFGRDLKARGMRAPALIVADGAPGIWKATRELWPGAIEQRCTVHALRNITSKLPERLHREVKARYWAVLDEATSASDAKAGLLALPGGLPARLPVGDAGHRRPCRPARRASALPARAPQTDKEHEPARAHLRRGPSAHQGDRPLPRRDLGAVAHLGRLGARQPRLARGHHDPAGRRADRAPAPRPDPLAYPQRLDPDRGGGCGVK